MKSPREIQLAKGFKFASKIIKKCEKELETKGIYENFGYNQLNKLSDYLDTLELLNYLDKMHIIQDFHLMCDNLNNNAHKITKKSM